MSQFSTNESVSLQKRIQTTENHQKTPQNQIQTHYDLENCAKWIKNHDFQKICLQFPDYLLGDSAPVARKLEELIGRKVYILGDTAYESCCIDFTSAQHVDADAIVHFGHSCYSNAEETIPFLRVSKKCNMNVEEFSEAVEKCGGGLTVVLDDVYDCKIDELRNRLNLQSSVVKIKDVDFSTDSYLYVGSNEKKTLNLKLSLNGKKLFTCNPTASYDIVEFEINSRILKRRCFLTEKIKDSGVIGIVIGTLAVRNYLKVLERVKALAKLHSKKYYVISVGKPTVAKLANFPEVDVYVVISCAMNEIYENRDFYKPIVTPFDVEAALNPRHSPATTFSYDYNTFLQKSEEITEDVKNDIVDSDVSLITGNVRRKTENVAESNGGTDLVLREDGKVALNSTYGAGYLSSRSWKGLEQGGAVEPHLAQKGRSGIAYGYENEKTEGM